MADSTPWPKGYRCAVVLTVDYNDIHGILTQAPEVAGRDKTLSVWRYGSQRGVERLLRLFKELGSPAVGLSPVSLPRKTPDTFRRSRPTAMKSPAPAIVIRTTTPWAWPRKAMTSPRAVRPSPG